MTLATHAVVGAATATLFPGHPVIAFTAGFMSHFLLDAIPHWDYKILSKYANPDIAMSVNAQGSSSSGRIKPDRLFWLDLSRIGADAALGALLVLIVWQPHSLRQWLILGLGAFGAMLPDFLQFVYMRFPREPLIALQKFHIYLMHAKSDLNHRPFVGIASQVAVMAFVIILVRYLVKL